MADDIQPTQTDTPAAPAAPPPDWTTGASVHAPANAPPPPAWADVKAAPEFAQLNPNEQVTAFNHWRNVAVNHATTLSGGTENVQQMTQDFNNSVAPEVQRLGKAAQDYNLQHPGFNEPTLEPEGFWGTAGRAVASRIGPAAAQAFGAGAGGAIGLGAGIETGPGAIATTLGGAAIGGVAAGQLAENAQKSLMGEEWYNRNIKQQEINAQAHPFAHTLGTTIPFLVSMFTGAEESAALKPLMNKIITEESPRIAKLMGLGTEGAVTGAAGGARAGALAAAQDKAEATPSDIAQGAGRGAITMGSAGAVGGALGLFPVMKTVLGQAIRGIPDSAVMATSGELYDSVQEGRPFNFKKVEQETGGSLPAFVLQNAVLGWLHGAPMRMKNAPATEAAPAEANAKPDAAVVAQRIQQLKDNPNQTPDVQKELADQQQLHQMLQPSPEAPKEAAPPITQAELRQRVEGITPPEAPAPEVKPPPSDDEAARLQRAKENIQSSGVSEEMKTKLIKPIDDELARRQPAPEAAAPAELTAEPVKAEPVAAKPAQIEPTKAEPTAEAVNLTTAEADTKQKLERAEGSLSEQGQQKLDTLRAKAEGTPQAPVELATKTRQDSAQKIWDDSLESGAVPTIQEVQKAVGAKGAKEFFTKLQDAHKEVYPAETLPEGSKELEPGRVEVPTGKTDANGNPVTEVRSHFTNDTEATAQQVNRGDVLPTVPKELEDKLNPNILTKRDADGNLQVTGVNHPDYGELRNAGDLDKAKAPEVAERSERQTKAETLPELTDEGKQAAQERLSVASTDDLDKLDKFMKSHSYTPEMEATGELYDAIKDRALKTIIRGKAPNDAHIQQMVQRFNKLQGEGVKTELPGPETGKELKAAPGAAEAPAPQSEAEMTLKKTGIDDPQSTLDKVNEGMRQRGQPEITMERLAELSQKAPIEGDPANSGAERSLLKPIPELVNSNLETLSKMGALDEKDPLGNALRHLSKNGSPIQKLIAKLFLGSGADTSRVPILHDNGMASRGVYDPLTEKIYLNLNSAHGRSDLEGTLLHEALHHITTWKLSGNYRPNAYEALQIQRVNRLLTQGRQAAMREVLGRDATKYELDQFQKYFKNDPNKKPDLSQETIDKLDTNYDKYYGLSNAKELVSEAANPEFVDFMSSLPPDKSLTARATNLYHQIREAIMNLVAGRPISQQAAASRYLEAVASISQEAPKGAFGGAFDVNLKAGGKPIGLQMHERIMDEMRNQGKTVQEILDRYKLTPERQQALAATYNDAYMLEKAGVHNTAAVMQELGPQRAPLPKEEQDRVRSPGQYASIMRDAGVPYVNNEFMGVDQDVQTAREELAKNPNAALERMDILGKTKSTASDYDFALFREHAVGLQRNLRDALVQKGDTSPEAKDAEAKLNNYLQKVYDETSKAGKSLKAVQGAININTGDFLDLKSYYKMVYGKDLTGPKVEAMLTKIVAETTDARINTLSSEIKLAQEIPKVADGIIAATEKEAGQTKLTSAEKKAAAKAGISEGKTATGENTGQLEFPDWKFNPKDAAGKLREYLQARFEAKAYREGDLTTREVGMIWKFIKANYLTGTTYVRPDELVNNVAASLGVTDTRIIKEAITAPKTLREFEAQRYKAQSQQRAIVNATKQFMAMHDKGKTAEVLARLWEAPRTLAVIGHVNPSLTHAGSLLFRPITGWKGEIASIGKAFRSSFIDSVAGKITGDPKLDSQIYHEKMLQDTMDSPNYAYLNKMGLAAKVGVLDDMGQYNTWLGKVGVAGNRGMDTLKWLRNQKGEQEYARLKGKSWFQNYTQAEKDQVVQEAMTRINTSTGTTTAGQTRLGNLFSGEWRTFLFAPRLEGARWQQMVVDPLRAAGLWLKGNNVTAGERYFRTKVMLETAEMMGTMATALGLNAGINHIVNPDDKINWTDPTRNDWLAFKIAGQTVIAPSSFLAPLRLSLSVLLSHIIPSENRQPFGDKIISYALGKVTPTISDMIELARAKQNYTGAPIEQLDNLYTAIAESQFGQKLGIHRTNPVNPKDPISIYHWAATKGPIPMASTVEAWYNAMVKQGAAPDLAKIMIGASLGAVFSIFAIHQHPTTPTKEEKQGNVF